MKLYQKLIRPMYKLGPDYNTNIMPIEKEVKWYPEEECECLKKKYASYDEEPFSELIFLEKFEPYAVEPKFKKLKVPEKCGECKSCSAAANGLPYCHMESVSSINSQMDISSIYVNIDSRPVWCPIIKMNDELDKMPIEKRAKFEKFIIGLSSCFGGEDLWD
ncbi:MAG: hypothetical protein LIR46_02925 [Bacteroidota bacterium]|nr:hypothetical protein [Bacteroidota bacterium]